MDEPIQIIDRLVAESVSVKQEFFRQHAQLLAEAAGIVTDTFRNGGKVLLFGNGGSAADAQHIAAEFVGRFVPERRPLPALSLVADGSVLSALGNDYGFDALFARQVSALGKAGDVAIAISTSGNSTNVLAGLDAARALGMRTIAFTGKDGGKMNDRADLVFRVPSRITPRIQETHIMLGHILCELVDRQLFPQAYPQE